jgi:hypothetical protein
MFSQFFWQGFLLPLSVGNRSKASASSDAACARCVLPRPHPLPPLPGLPPYLVPVPYVSDEGILSLVLLFHGRFRIGAKVLGGGARPIVLKPILVSVCT